MTTPSYKSANQKYCLECGAVIARIAEECPRCEKAQAITVVRKVRKTKASDLARERLITGILALALGSFGAHRFYLGHWRIGVLIAIFFWTGIPLLWGIYEGIKILHSTDKDFARDYL